MTPERKAEPLDPVQRAAHYNVHPSGVECIEIVEHLSFNVGNAVKYVWRRGDKGNPSQDLEKAAWYFRHEAKRLSQPGMTTMWFDRRWHDAAWKVVQSEADRFLSGILVELLGSIDHDAATPMRCARFCEDIARSRSLEG